MATGKRREEKNFNEVFRQGERESEERKLKINRSFDRIYTCRRTNKTKRRRTRAHCFQGDTTGNGLYRQKRHRKHCFSRLEFTRASKQRERERETEENLSEIGGFHVFNKSFKFQLHEFFNRSNNVQSGVTRDVERSDACSIDCSVTLDDRG